MLPTADNGLQTRAHQILTAFDWLYKQREQYPDNADI